jgi:hydroxymethylpyrimidine pyrophosphatase-like HAD family hydrolase
MERFTTHIEKRIGLINFSVVGRDCPQEVRDRYHKWDLKVKERETFCQIIEEKFPHIEASVGGQISIDIHSKGKNKAQVLDEIDGEIVFFGDKCEPGGNDYPIVERLFPLIDEHTIHNVKDWGETYKILNQYG